MHSVYAQIRGFLSVICKWCHDSARSGVGKALRHAQMVHKSGKCSTEKLLNKPSMRPGRVIGDKHFNLCSNFVMRKIKT